MFFDGHTNSAMGLAWVTRPGSAVFYGAMLAWSVGVVWIASQARRTLQIHKSLRVDFVSEALVLMPLDRWSTITKKGLSLALQLRGQVRVLHVEAESSGEELENLWQRNVIAPLQDADRRIPELVLLKPAERRTLSPIVRYILEAERREPERQIVVVVPKLSVRHWWQRPLHNHRSWLLKFILSVFGSQRMMIIDVPWYL